MFKKLSATILFLAMAFVIVAEQPALEYCSCDGSFHIAGADCCSMMNEQESCCPGCAGTPSDEITSTPENRCKDCKIAIVIDVADYCWFTSTEIPDLHQPIFVEFTGSAIILPSGDVQNHSVWTAHPDPLPERLPLFLEKLSLRL